MPNDKIMAIPQDLLILGAAVKTGMVEALRKSTNCTDLAKELNLDPRAVWVVVEALASLGYVTRQGETLTLSEEARGMIYNPSAPNYIGFAFMHRYNMLRSWAYLPETLAGGQKVRSDRDPENTRYFMEAMHYGAEKSAPPIADFLLADSVNGIRVLDVGGGPLTYSTAFAARGAKVTVQDLPPVVQLMQEKAEKAGINLFPGDFNVELPAELFDLAFLGNVCHIFGEEENQELFRKVSQVLVTGGRIAIVDMIRGTNKNTLAAVFGVNMLVSTRKGGSWTLEQYVGWLASAGFRDVKLDEIAYRQIITAIKE